MPFIQKICSNGISTPTTDRIGSFAEERYHRVMICSGSVLDSQTKYFFESKEAFEDWTLNARQHTESKGYFAGPGPAPETITN
jgi:hypothetical protein